MTISYELAVNLAKELKKETKALILIGGCHISTHPQSFTKEFDIGILGEGEQTILEIIEEYEKNRSIENLEKIDGVILNKKGKIIITKKRNLIFPLDKIPKPDLSLIDERYFCRKPRFYFGGKNLRESWMFTSRGCPYRCTFCSTSLFWDKTRFFSVPRVISEFKNLVDNQKSDAIVILDDLFTINKSRLKEILKGLEDEGLLGKFKLYCQPRANLIDEEMCKILKKMGTVTVSFGFESGSQRILSYLKKDSVTVEQNKNALLLCKKYGFNVLGSFILGVPQETRKDIEETINIIDFMMKNRIDAVWLFSLTPYPGTECWYYAKSRGIVNDEMNWNLFTLENDEVPMYMGENVSLAEFKDIFIRTRKKLDVYNIYKEFERKPKTEKIKRLSNPRSIKNFAIKYMKNKIL